eukprot:GHVU01005937.1.p1 GENE.GHVU01005937.1~~GHVU01005937.1.p1  ORF type:complete len:246 (+),score=47.50 GHVU01005937.1:2-739(+)
MQSKEHSAAAVDGGESLSASADNNNDDDDVGKGVLGGGSEDVYESTVESVESSGKSSPDASINAISSSSAEGSIPTGSRVGSPCGGVRATRAISGASTRSEGKSGSSQPAVPPLTMTADGRLTSESRPAAELAAAAAAETIAASLSGHDCRADGSRRLSWVETEKEMSVRKLSTYEPIRRPRYGLKGVNKEQEQQLGSDEIINSNTAPASTVNPANVVVVANTTEQPNNYYEEREPDVASSQVEL